MASVSAAPASVADIAVGAVLLIVTISVYCGRTMDRRDFLKTTAGTIAAGTLASNTGEAAEQPRGFLAAPPIELVRIGYVGIGGMGSAHVGNLLKVPGCRITAVCDVNPERTAWATKAITEAGHPAPAVYTRGPRDFERVCAEQDLDLV